MEIYIQRIGSEHLQELQAIGRQTFYETFAAHNTEANIQQYMAEGFEDKKLLDELANPHSEFYFVYADGVVAGYLKLNFGDAQTEQQAADSMEIERIYVQSAYHGKQVGQVLIDKAMEIAHSRKVSYVWLGVWEKNHRAMRFYQRNGFQVFDKHVFQMGQEAQTDYLMMNSQRFQPVVK